MFTVDVRLPVVKRGNVILIRSRDFWFHRDEVLIKLLPNHRIRVMRPAICYEVIQPPLLERVAYPFTMPEPEEEWPGFHKRGRHQFLRVSELQRREGWILREAIARQILRFTVTFYGWADFTVLVEPNLRPVHFNPVVTHDPRSGIREERVTG